MREFVDEFSELDVLTFDQRMRRIIIDAVRISSTIRSLPNSSTNSFVASSPNSLRVAKALLIAASIYRRVLYMNDYNSNINNNNFIHRQSTMMEKNGKKWFAVNMQQT